MNLKRAFAATSVASALAAISLVGVAAQAAPAQSVQFFISAPKVEGSYLSSGGDVSFENFDNGCNTTWSMGTITPSCTAANAANYGGAVTESSSPVNTTGGVGTKFLAISAGNDVTLNLTTASRYVGFWWSGGDARNTISFYKGSTLLLTITTTDIVNALANDTLTAQDNTVYNSYEYYGNPRVAVGTSNSDKTTLEPFAYIHLMIKGGASFDKIVMSQAAGGGGFELDNFLTKVALPAVDPSLVKISDTPLSNPDPTVVTPKLADTGSESNVLVLVFATLSAAAGAGAILFSRKQS